jgi:hypothetical protein
MEEKDSRSTGNRDLYRAGGIALFGAAIALIVQLPLVSLASNALYANATATGLAQLHQVTTSYTGFISSIVALDVFGILAFGAWYFAFRRINLVGALGALLIGVVALTVDLAVDLPIRFAEISAASEYAVASTAQQPGVLAVFQFMLDFSNDTLLMSTFLLGVAFLFLAFAMLKGKSMFGNLVSYLALLTGILVLIQVPLALPASTTPFLVSYLAATIVQIVFFVLAGIRFYRL